MSEPDEKSVALIIDDDAGIRYVIDSTLTRAGYRVVCGATVAEGMALLREKKPKWIVLDLRLPDGSGAAILRVIRTQHVPVKVAVITADSTLLSEVEALRPDKVWVKPLVVAEIVAWLKTGAADERRADPQGTAPLASVAVRPAS